MGNKISSTGRNNLLSKCACGDTSQRYNKWQELLHLLCTSFPSGVNLVVFIKYIENQSLCVHILLCFGNIVFWKLPLVHSKLPQVHAKSPWTRHNFEMQIAPGSCWLISRLAYYAYFSAWFSSVQLSITQEWIECIVHKWKSFKFILNHPVCPDIGILTIIYPSQLSGFSWRCHYSLFFC